eukprot:CAMPEP_0115202936 /NCGR_PEP_ID=MMETSP0270-20121206/18388_1 /TAXON_ID=71861 /ORGANISM="Scrippsiella trochoidea, Strain CCMP3099" /LENGTH=192 /DNA_ID=CAMNT_0002616375 /DNA_START=99 /DNA_END=674 /DNA_ORIENTATION=+
MLLAENSNEPTSPTQRWLNEVRVASSPHAARPPSEGSTCRQRRTSHARALAAFGTSCVALSLLVVLLSASSSAKGGGPSFENVISEGNENFGAPPRALEATPAVIGVGRDASRRASSGSNPFVGRSFYVNPVYSEELGLSISSAEGQTKATLEEMQDVPSAYWLDKKGKILGEGTSTMEGILADAAAKSPPQ